eukprot:7726065-Pyramimonas_sp.AAC.1
MGSISSPELDPQASIGGVGGLPRVELTLPTAFPPPAMERAWARFEVWVFASMITLSKLVGGCEPS